MRHILVKTLDEASKLYAEIKAGADFAALADVHDMKRQMQTFRGQTEITVEGHNVKVGRGATIGAGFFIDHGTGVVIGETAVVGDDVSMLHGVTLGGTGAGRGDRHPKVGRWWMANRRHYLGRGPRCHRPSPHYRHPCRHLNLFP